MFRRGVLLTIFLQVTQNVQTSQQVQLSESYLPVAMQVIAHLTDQMAFEVKDDLPPRTSTTAKPLDITTPFHKPGLFAPPYPPKPTDKGISKNQNYVLLPVEQNAEYTIIEPQEKKTEEPFLSAHDEEVKPLMEPKPNLSHQFLPFEQDIKASRRSDGYEDIDEESLQYLSQNVRDMIRMANDPDDDRVVDVWDGLRASPSEPSARQKLSSSNLRLLLLYDLLSRDAKRQRLSDYTGFSPNVMRALVESSGGGARAQLSMALARMVERHDCGHEYANNRAREMVAELARDESKLSSELRYLQPLVYKF
ncbi:jg11147 [Pararge aegeria aegeria]|uniref:Jg11147 protein n=2 Tax=Pararge aegeria TaxID=116150 RepID=A0A8S4RHI6_9NEOP|nr:jg11147 [Pararge aegeria aegeria]